MYELKASCSFFVLFFVVVRMRRREKRKKPMIAKVYYLIIGIFFRVVHCEETHKCKKSETSNSKAKSVERNTFVITLMALVLARDD